MTQADIAKWLGRSLTPVEVTNFDSYLNNAQQRVEALLCFPLCGDADVKKFKARSGMSTIFTGVYTDIDEVILNGVAVSNFESMFFDDANTSFYNSVVFDEPLTEGDKIEVSASWGFQCVPDDLGQLIAKYFNLVSSGVRSDTGVSKKRVEDFEVWFDNNQTADGLLVTANQSVINKYSLCNTTNIQSGKVCRVWI